jgi:hypothetical protein
MNLPKTMRRNKLFACAIITLTPSLRNNITRLPNGNPIKWTRNYVLDTLLYRLVDPNQPTDSHLRDLLAAQTIKRLTRRVTADVKYTKNTPVSCRLHIT